MSESAARTDPKIYKDLNWLLGLLTLVAVIMYGVVLFMVPAIRQPVTLIVFTALLAVHLFLHWQLVRIAARPAWLAAYVIVQGLLFFAIGFLCANPNMIFPLFAGLLGEAIGTLRQKRQAIPGIAYYLLLLIGIFLLRFELAVSAWLIVGTAAIVVSTVLYTVLYKQQMDARVRAQSLLSELETANHQLSEYAARVEDLTSAAERQRMARELHDTLSQGLAGLILQLEAVEAHLTSSRPERALRIVQEAKAGARQTLAESRQAIADLREAGVSDLGEAARQEAKHFTSSTGLSCALEITLPPDLPEPLSETALRVIAEGLTNIARHARAKNVKLRLVYLSDPAQLEIGISDDGVGFDPASIEAGHYGLLGMRERVRLAGGSLELQSNPGKGTSLLVRLPLKNDAQGGNPAAALAGENNSRINAK